jgi:hypothetical protein
MVDSAGMNLRTFLLDMDRRQELAERLGVNPHYLWQLGVKFQAKGAKRPKRPSTDLARRIEKETTEMGFRVSKASLRPDVWKEEESDS